MNFSTDLRMHLKEKYTPSTKSFTLMHNFKNKIEKPLVQHPSYNLKFLDLSNQKLRFITVDLISLKNLEHLILDNNYLTKISDDLCSLSLENLSLKKNLIRNFPEKWGELGNRLLFLDLQHNEIDKLEPNLRELISLKVLKINNNAFTSICRELGSLEKLVLFDIEWGKYTNPPLDQSLTGSELNSLKE